MTIKPMVGMTMESVNIVTGPVKLAQDQVLINVPLVKPFPEKN